MALRFHRPVAVCPERGVFIFTETRPAPLEGFDPSVFDVIPCPVDWQSETAAQRKGRLQKRRRERREAGLC
jgi:hypothetical protein